MTTAVIFVPADTDHFELYLSQCLAFREECGYEDAGVVRELDDAVAMQAAGLTTVIVIARRDHLPPDGGPRIEVAGERPITTVRVADKARNAPRMRRPRRL